MGFGYLFLFAQWPALPSSGFSSQRPPLSGGVNEPALVLEVEKPDMYRSARERRRTLTVGNVEELRTEREALNRIQILRTNLNHDSPRSALMTFKDLIDHYRQTELLADNKTEKTKNTYLVYLKNWILPTWGKEYLHNIKPVAVEQWLRNLRELSNGSKCKIRNIMSGIFSHAIRYEFAVRNPITAVRQSGKRQKVPVLLEVAHQFTSAHPGKILRDAVQVSRRCNSIWPSWSKPIRWRSRH